MRQANLRGVHAWHSGQGLPRPSDGGGDATTGPDTDRPGGTSEGEFVEVDVPSQFTEWAAVHSRGEPRRATRSEHRLVLDFKAHLEANDLVVKSARIAIPGEGTFENDIWVPERKHLIEAKSSALRESIRMAIGQIADYRRTVEPDATAVLVRHRPSRDLEALLESQDIGVIWRDGDGFADNRGGAFT